MRFLASLFALVALACGPGSGPTTAEQPQGLIGYPPPTGGGGGGGGDLTAVAVGNASLTVASGTGPIPSLTLTQATGWWRLYDDGWNPVTAATGQTGFLAQAAGASAAITQGTAEPGRPGLLAVTTGTTTTGRASWTTTGGVSTIAFSSSSGVQTAHVILRLDDLSTVSEEYTIRMGFIDAVAADSVDGAYIEYDRTASVNWRCKTSANSVRTATNGSVAVAEDVFVRGTVTVTNDTSVSFEIDGVSICAAHTANIPTGTTRGTGIGVAIIKSAGTTARTFSIDAIDAYGPVTR